MRVSFVHMVGSNLPARSRSLHVSMSFSFYWTCLER